MTELILLLSLWPHHKVHKVADGCAVGSKLFWYMGDDLMIGFSPASCEAAKYNWKITHIDPVRMSRS